MTHPKQKSLSKPRGIFGRKTDLVRFDPARVDRRIDFALYSSRISASLKQKVPTDTGQDFLERETGIGPATFSLATRRSTTELFPQ